jgi:hypothetical protein
MKHVKLTRVFSVSGASDLDAHTDLVMNELLKLENEFISDSDVSASLTDHEVEITVVARADDFDEARKLADSTIRTAIHAAGGSTPSWTPPIFDPTSDAAELINA